MELATTLTGGTHRDVFVHERYKLPQLMKGILRNRTPRFGFNGIGEVTYFRTYSRLMPNGQQEQWSDTVIRVVEGVMSIRKDWYAKHRLKWDEQKWDHVAMSMADAIFEMRFLPPGRGLWAMGTDYIYERGSAALNNCGFVDVKHLSQDASWAMDMLMCGVGVGFSTQNLAMTSTEPEKQNGITTYVIPDTREGWVESVRLLIESYEKGGKYLGLDYSKVRKYGEPIRGFGGTSSGPGPLIKLHQRIRSTLDTYSKSDFPDSTLLIADVMNAIGACVVAGNVRRSAEIAIGSVNDQTFINLKNAEVFPERQDISWMSNNSVSLNNSDDFLKIPLIADRIRDNGEPGVLNMINITKFGRLFEQATDNATGVNPCSEIPLRSYELCNLAEVFPTRCVNADQIIEAAYLATIYSSTVSLLPTQREETNDVIAENRRIGVSMSGIADWMEFTPSSVCTRIVRDTYKTVKKKNGDLAKEAGISPAIRVTTVKPSGTISLLAGVSPGMHWPTFRYAIRRMRIGEGSPLVSVLENAGVPSEADAVSDNTRVFEFPIDQGGTRAATEVSVWQQAARVAMLQREWADNMVSNTLYFSETEKNDIENVLGEFAPLSKSMSMLPHSDKGAFAQMPYEGISKEEVFSRQSAITKPDWSVFSGSDGLQEVFCSNNSCVLV